LNVTIKTESARRARHKNDQELTLTQKQGDTWKHTAQGGSWARRAAKRATAFAIDAGITILGAVRRLPLQVIHSHPSYPKDFS